VVGAVADISGYSQSGQVDFEGRRVWLRLVRHLLLILVTLTGTTELQYCGTTILILHTAVSSTIALATWGSVRANTSAS